MNRKLITSEQLNWPEVDDETNARLLQCLEQELVKHECVKRVKNLPKKQREKLKEEKVEGNAEEEERKKKKSREIRSQFIFGINSVTRYLESLDGDKAKRLLCVLTCRSCKPLRILTQHILIMCSQKKIKAACVNNLSTTVSKLFNINRASAVAILDDSNDEQGLLHYMLNEIKANVIPRLPELENPFVNVYEGDLSVKQELVAVQSVPESAPVRNLDEIFSFNAKKEQTKAKSMDFMSFGDEETAHEVINTLTSFHDRNFILFDTNSTTVIAEDDKSETRPRNKRAIEFKQFDVSMRRINHEKSKEKKNLKKKLTETKATKKKFK